MNQPDPAVLAGISLIVLDIDGVLTDGSVIVDESGVTSRVFDIKDGLGIVRLIESGRGVAVISSSTVSAGVERLERLGVNPIRIGAGKKIEVLQELVTSRGLDWAAVAYLGDDLPDLECLGKVGLAVAPADAVAEVRAIAHLVTTASGGRGAVRELSDLILAASQGGQ